MFNKFTSRLAAAISKFSTPSERKVITDRLDEAVSKSWENVTEPQSKQEPVAPRYRLRDRNTKFSRRHPAMTPREIHETANNKGIQFISNARLTGLLWASGAMDASTELNERYPSAKLARLHDSTYEVVA